MIRNISGLGSCKLLRSPEMLNKNRSWRSSFLDQYRTWLFIEFGLSNLPKFDSRPPQRLKSQFS